jgi:hypothetical protein
LRARQCQNPLPGGPLRGSAQVNPSRLVNYRG